MAGEISSDSRATSPGIHRLRDMGPRSVLNRGFLGFNIGRYSPAKQAKPILAGLREFPSGSPRNPVRTCRYGACKKRPSIRAVMLTAVARQNKAVMIATDGHCHPFIPPFYYRIPVTTSFPDPAVV
jgi:hypothetical protein